MNSKKELIEAIMDPNNWKPNITRITEETGLARSTVHEQINKRLSNCEIELTIKALNEAEALEKRKALEKKQ